MTKGALAKGAVILSIAGFISKIIGAGYRIPLFRLIGAEGMGIYQMAYPLYTLLLTISSAGIPVAVSKLVAERVVLNDRQGTRDILLVSLVMLSLIGALCTTALYILAGFLSREVLKDERAYYSIVAIAPAVFFVGLMSVFRGYFQGFQQMYPTAISQIIEQAVRVATVLIGAYLFLPRGIEYAAAAATSGAVAGAVAGLGVLLVCYVWKSAILPPVWTKGMGGQSLSLLMTGYRILALSLPISFGGLVLPMVQILDAVTVPLRLQQAGYSVAKAAELYGELTGGAVTLVNVPTIFTLALATSLVPVISELHARKNKFQIYRNLNAAVKAAVSICLPAAMGLYLLAEPIADLLFNCPEAGVPLSILAPAAVFLGLHQTTSGVLQGLGRTHLPVKNLLVGVVVKLGLNYYLTGLPVFGIRGPALGTLAGFCISSVLNLADLRRVTDWRLSRQVLSKPAVAATIMAVGVYLTFGFLKLTYNMHLATVLTVLFGVGIYFVVLALIDRGNDSTIMLLVNVFRKRS